MKQHYREVFNDGFLEYGYKKTQRSESGKKTGEAFTSNGKLAYKEMTARDSDYQLAGAMGSKLDLKVKTMFPPSFRSIVKSKLKVVIRGKEFDVIKVDHDTQTLFLYFLLQEVGG